METVEKGTASSGYAVPDNDSFDFSDKGNWSMWMDSAGKWHFVDHGKEKWSWIKKYLPHRWIVAICDGTPHPPYWKVTWGKLSLKLWNVNMDKIGRL